MNEIGNDEVIAALQAIIDKFGDYIEPHAVALVTQLTAAFTAYCDAGEDDDDAAMAAAQCLECISTVLKGICERPELFKTLEPALIPITKQILGKDGDFIEYLEYALDIITFLTYFPDDISNELWEVFPMIYIAFDQWAFDYLNLMVPPLENFIGKAPQVFITKQSIIEGKAVSYADLIFNMVRKTIAEERASESEMRKALSLLMSLLLNCKGMIDNYLPAINDLVLTKLGQQAGAETPLTRIALFVVLGSALFYNPQIELIELEKKGFTKEVFTQWLGDVEHMDKWLPRKITVVGFCSMLQLPSATLPPSVSSMIPQIITAMTMITSKIEEDANKPDDCDDDLGVEVPHSGYDDDFEGFEEDEDVHSVTDDAYLDALKNISGHDDVARFLIGDAWMDDDDDDEDFISPLDDIETLVYYRDSLRVAFDREPVFYQQVQGALPQDTVQKCQQLFALADAKPADGN